MRVGFTRDGRLTRVTVHRDDGVELQTATTQPKQALLPHDLEHFVVENAVGLTSGLWGRVAAGAEFTSFVVTTPGPRKRSRAAGRALTRGMSGWDEHVISVVIGCYREAVASGWAPPAPLPAHLPIERQLKGLVGLVEQAFTRADIENACAALHRAIAEWESTAEHETMTVTWELPVKRRAPRPSRR
jgi:hypothetical protein